MGAQNGIFQKRKSVFNSQLQLLGRSYYSLHLDRKRTTLSSNPSGTTFQAKSIIIRLRNVPSALHGSASNNTLSASPKEWNLPALHCKTGSKTIHANKMAGACQRACEADSGIFADRKRSSSVAHSVLQRYVDVRCGRDLMSGMAHWRVTPPPSWRAIDSYAHTITRQRCESKVQHLI